MREDGNLVRDIRKMERIRVYVVEGRGERKE